VLSAVGHPGDARFRGNGFTFWNLYLSALVGLIITFLLVAITEFYTVPAGIRSRRSRGLADGHATNISRAGRRHAGQACRCS